MKKLYFSIFLLTGFLAFAGTPALEITTVSSTTTKVVQTSIEIGNGPGFISVLNLPSGNYSFELLDITGKMVKCGSLTKGSGEVIKTSDLKNGLYMLKISGEGNFLTVRKVYVR